MARPRLGFGPTVGLGVLTAGLSVVASTKPWLDLSDTGAVAPVAVLQGLTDAPPLAAALSLVLLAGWGALLVTRGRIRRAVAGLTVLAALGLVGIAINFAISAGADAKLALEDLGAGDVDTTLGPWFWIAILSALASTVVGLVAVRSSPNWPEMSRRYDAPGGAETASGETDLTSTIDVWKAMDQGKDPTA